ncbi:MAG TPA: FecR domain-containing protein [Ohtaekwangia sp.]|uniref:FecR domain-containing protein n=1 Tax=Ohtaekwangia sp. TaxID=2066019 RepID=UPI002F93E19A
MNTDFNDSVKELMTRYLASEASPDEEKELLAWIARAPENEKHYQEYKKLFDLSREHYTRKETDRAVDLDLEWNHFLNTIQQKKSESNVRTLEPRSFAVWYKIAASILLLAVTGWIVLQFLPKGKDVQYQTASNTLTVSLPDGSQVTLNSHSSLSYSASYNDDNRTVALKGEAFFNVTRNPQKPFIIQANDAQVEVLGTSFNVLAYDSLSAVEVVVETGVVKLSVPALKTEVKLEAGQKGIYSRQASQLSSKVNDDINFQSWNTRKIVFEEEDLRTVIATLNRIYQANITVAADIPASCAVTVTFDHQSLEAVLRVLENTLNLTYKINGNQIEITAAGC